MSIASPSRMRGHLEAIKRVRGGYLQNLNEKMNNSNKNLPDHTSVFKYLLSPNMCSQNWNYCHKYKTKNAMKVLYIKSKFITTNFLHNVLSKQNYQVTLSDIILDSVHCKLTYCLRRQKLEVQCGNMQRLAPSSRRLLFHPVVLDARGCRV